MVAADDPETARRAAAAVTVDYEVLPAVDRRDARPWTRTTRCTRAATSSATSDPPGRPVGYRRVVVTGEYEVGMQDQAFLGPESGLAVPAEDGGVDLYIATQWLHVDQDQIAASLGLPARQGPPHPGRGRRRVRRPRGPVAADPPVPAGAADGAAGEDGVLAGGVVLRPRAPAPGPLRYTHGAPRDGRLVFVQAEMVFDGGAYMSSHRPWWPTRHARRRPLRGAQRVGRLLGASTPTTRRAGRCAVSGPSRRASPTSPRWTSWPKRSGWTRSSSGPATPWPGGRSCRRARSWTARPR